MKIALDIDDTITANPEFFSIVSRAVRRDGGRIYVVTSRLGIPESERETKRELDTWGIEFDELIFIPASGDPNQIPCPHEDLDWYQKYLWQKVKICLDRGVDLVFEDDPKVIALFEKCAPAIRTCRIGIPSPAPEPVQPAR